MLLTLEKVFKKIYYGKATGPRIKKSFPEKLKEIEMGREKISKVIRILFLKDSR